MSYDEWPKWITQIICNPESLLLFGVWLGSLVFCVSLFRKRLARVYLTRWYDLSKRGPNQEMDWSQIRDIMNNDALEKMPIAKRLRLSKRYLLWDIIGLPIIGLIFYSILVLLLNHKGIEVEHGVAIGIVTILVSIATIFYNVRLKSRSQNRQEWINALRKEIGALILVPPRDRAKNQKAGDDIRDIGKHFAMLELYLNPSERVHRAFMTVLRLMYGQVDQEMDACVNKRLGIDDSVCPGATKDVEQEQQWTKWRAKAVRLANVLLKREWEQVKHVK